MARGDHLFVHCLGYSHHGIDVGGGRVIHFDHRPWHVVTQHLGGQHEPRVREVDLAAFAHDRPIVVRHYPACDSADIVVARARSRLAETDYDLFQNNCEHFAVWCKTGHPQSTQVHDFLDATRPLSRALPAAAMLMRTARRLPGRLRTVAYGAAFAMTAGAFAHRYLENRLRRAVNRES